MPRLFIAVPVEKTVRRKIAEKLEGWREVVSGWRWVAPHLYHITMKFLGDVPEHRVHKIVKAVGDSALGVGPIGLSAHGVGAFPSRQRARVFWVGVRGDTDALHHLQTRIDVRLAGIGFSRENRLFSPHVTVARIRQPGPLPEVWQADMDHEFGLWTADTVQVIESQLSTEGPHYHIRHEVELRGYG